MARNTERVLFIIIGCFLVLFGYILDKSNGAPQAEFDDVPVFDKIFVREAIVVGDPKSLHYIDISAKEEGASIHINTHRKGLCGRVIIAADDKSASILTNHSEGYKGDDNVSGFVWIKTTEDEIANIMLLDKKGKNTLTTQ